ncbi:MAG: hypothetical protein AAB477_01385 [Patescibacteria group bacterium]
MPKEQFMFNEKPQETRDRIAQEAKAVRKGETTEYQKYEGDTKYKVKNVEDLIRAEKNYDDFDAANFFHSVAREKITSGEAENLEQANILASRELAETFLSCMENESIGRFTEAFAMRAKGFFDKKYQDNKAAYKILEKFRAESTYRDNAEGSFYYETGMGLSLAHLPYDEAFSYTQKLISAIEKPDQFDDVEAYQFSSKDFKENIALAFLKLQCDNSEKLQKFMNSEIAKFVKPELVIDQAAKKKMGAEVIKPLIEKYGVDIVAKLSLFGENGVFADFEKSEKEKLLVEILEGLDSKVDNKIQEIEKRNEEITGKGKDWNPHNLSYLSIQDGYVREQLAHIEGAMGEGIIPENYEEIFRKIQTSINESSKHPSSNYVGNRSERDEVSAKLAKLRVEADKLSGKELGIKGKGVELEGTKLFSEGKLIAVLEGASFGEKYTNGDIVTWKRTEKLDSERVLGNQVKLSIWGYKNGKDKPSELYDANYWSAGKYVNVSNPEVSDDGVITFTVEKEGGEKETITKTIS